MLTRTFNQPFTKSSLSLDTSTPHPLMTLSPSPCLPLFITLWTKLSKSLMRKFGLPVRRTFHCFKPPSEGGGLTMADPSSVPLPSAPWAGVRAGGEAVHGGHNGVVRRGR
eukprot:EG_transcript_42020